MKKYAVLLSVVFIAFLFASCGKGKQETTTPGQSAATSPDKETQIQEYNLRVKEEQSQSSSPCDTVALLAYVLKNYPVGSYIVKFDKTLTYNIPKPAVIYLNRSDTTYVLAAIARSKPGERYIEPKNVVGYDQSFIDLDSTKLGTAFFYLTLFRCDNGTFSEVWEDPIPNHGGFNDMKMEKWAYNGTPYCKVDFHYARGIGHIDYNYFFINGLTEMPHLLMTYKGIDFERTLANVNDDVYPDYYEHIFFNLRDRIYSRDSVAFIWDTKDSVYVNTRNRRQTRPY